MNEHKNKNEIQPFAEMVSFPNLMQSFAEFRRGKKSKPDVAWFTMHAIKNIQKLSDELSCGTYRHGGYIHFRINDPKPRDIHKASVRDRVVHHALYRALYPHFDKKFIHDSYSCRVDKGTHRALDRFKQFGNRASNNHTKIVWVLKCDIRKCFASVDHIILKRLLDSHVSDSVLQGCLHCVIDSFAVTAGKGIPLGNLTSQLFINVYLNELDHFVKRELKEKFYVRYADDFVIFSQDKTHLEKLILELQEFLWETLGLTLHPDKVFIKTVVSGVDFLGWIHFPRHRVLRTKTKKHMMRRLHEMHFEALTLSAYEGLLSHGNAYGLLSEIREYAKLLL